MVVVNDASHMIGRENVVIEVLSTRRTNQGLLVFAKLADRPSNAGPIANGLRTPPPRRRVPRRRRGRDRLRLQALLTAATSFVSVSLASPKSIVVFGS
jgi:hypothetical protein